MKKLKDILLKLPFIGTQLILIKNKVFPFDSPSVWLDKLLGNDKITIVQIGSNDGLAGDPIYDLVKKNEKWRCIFVEPVPYLFERLKKNYGNDKRFTFENVAINDGVKQTFYSVDNKAKNDIPNLPYWYDQLGSFNKENIIKHLDGLLEPYIKELTLKGITLEALFKQNGIESLDLLHIDTEGYDWKILSQLNLENIKPNIILIEHKHLQKTERKKLIHFLEEDYLTFKLGGDMIGIYNNPTNRDKIKSLKGKSIT